MKKIERIIYIAEDGREFSDPVKCHQYEILCIEIGQIMEPLYSKPKNDDCQFSNGHGYIQHDATTFYSVREQLLRIANKIIPHKWFTESIENPTSCHPSWPGRLISDMGGPLNSAWYRIMCIDSQFREWGQIYYADHPDEAEQFQLNT